MLFWQGMGIGLAIAAPVGVIGILCIQRTLTGGRWIGFVSGMGAATADGIYGAIAGLGLGAIAQALLSYRQWLLLGGGLFLVYLGILTFRQRPPTDKSPRFSTQTALQAYSSTLVLTLTNPLTIFSFLGIFAGLGLGQTARPQDAIALIAGVFTGSALWWLLLSHGTHWLRRWVTPQRLQWINRVAGSAIATFGIVALVQFVRAGR